MTRRKTTLGALIALALTASIALAPAASAQLVPLGEDDPDPISEAVGKVKDTAEDTSEQVKEQAPEPVQETVEGVGATAEETWKDIENDVKQIAPPPPTLPTDTKNTPKNTKGGTEKTGGNGPGHSGPGSRESAAERRAAAAAMERAAERRADRALAQLVALEKKQQGVRSLTPASDTTVEEPLLAKVAAAAAEAARKLGFPMVLTLMVVAFLIVQGRIDRKDAKLALAPISVEEELLSFQ